MCTITLFHKPLQLRMASRGCGVRHYSGVTKTAVCCPFCREREKQRLHELSSTLQDLSLRMHEQAIQDAETELLEKEAEQLQQLSRELDAELAAFQNRISVPSDCVSSRADSSPSSLPTQSSGETSQGSLQSSTIPCSLAGASQQHHTMYEAYEYLVRFASSAQHLQKLFKHTVSETHIRTMRGSAGTAKAVLACNSLSCFVYD